MLWIPSLSFVNILNIGVPTVVLKFHFFSPSFPLNQPPSMNTFGKSSFYFTTLTLVPSPAFWISCPTARNAQFFILPWASPLSSVPLAELVTFSITPFVTPLLASQTCLFLPLILEHTPIQHQQSERHKRVSSSAAPTPLRSQRADYLPGHNS